MDGQSITTNQPLKAFKTVCCILVFNPKTPGLSILHISPGRVSCFLPQMHSDPICIFYLIPPGMVTCMPYSGGTGLARALSHSHTDPHNARPENVETLCLQFWSTYKRILQIWKSASILRSSGIWISFQICNIPLLSAPNWHAKCLNILRLGTVRICVQMPGWNRLSHFAR